MEYCSTGPFAAPAAESGRVEDAAEQLACLLAGTQALQDFARLSRVVHLDEEVRAILAEIDGCGWQFTAFGENPAQEQEPPEERLEALPVVREYRQAERAVRALLRGVDVVVSTSAGIPFAEYARSSAFG